MAAGRSRDVGTGVRDAHLQDGGFVVRTGQQDQVILQKKGIRKGSQSSTAVRKRKWKCPHVLVKVMGVFQAHQQDSFSFDHNSPGSRVQNKRFHKVVLGNIDKPRFHAGSKDDLLGLFGT